MYIKQINISNFRNIQQTTIDFIPNYNFIIGNNGNGKSTILKAINFIFELKPIPKENRIEYIYKQQDTLTANVSIEINITEKEMNLFKETFKNIETNKIKIKRKLSLFEDELKINGIKTSLINLETFLINNQLISPMFYFNQGGIINSLIELNNSERYELLKKSCSIFSVEKEIKQNIKILNQSRSAFAENSEFLSSLELKIRKYRKMKIYKQEYDNLELEKNDIEIKLKGIEINKLENNLKKYENNDNLEIKKHLNELENKLLDYKLIETKNKNYLKIEINELTKEIENKEIILKNIIKEIEDIEIYIKKLQEKLYELIIEKKAVSISLNLNLIKNEEDLINNLKELNELKKQPKKISLNKKSIGFSSLIDKRKLIWNSIKDLKNQIKKEEYELRKFKLKYKIIEKLDIKIDFKYVYELINIPKELTIAVSSIIGNLLFAIVVKTEEEAHKIINLIKNINIICLERLNKERRSLIKHEELIRMSNLIQTEGYELLIEMLFKEYFLVSDLNTGLEIINKLENNEIKKSNLRNTNLRNLKLITISGEKIRYGEIQTNFKNYNKLIYLPDELNNKIKNIKKLNEILKINKEEINNLTKEINYIPNSNNLIEKEDNLLKILTLENQIKRFKGEFINKNFKNINLIENDISEKTNQIEILKIEKEGLNILINENKNNLLNLIKNNEKIENKLLIENKIKEIKNKGFSNKIDILKQQTILEKNKIQEKIQILKKEIGTIKIILESEDILINKKEEILKKLEKYKIGEKENFNENIKKIDSLELEKGKEIFESYEGFYKKNEELKQTSIELKYFIEKLIKHKEKIFNNFLIEFELNFKKMLNYLPFKVTFNIKKEDIEEIKEIEKMLIYSKINGEFFINELINLSGGQKSLITLLFIISLQMTQPSFIYLLDEVDASIDLENREIFINILKKNIINSQFFMISFNSDMLNIEGRILKVTNGNINEITKQEGINLLNNK